MFGLNRLSEMGLDLQTRQINPPSANQGLSTVKPHLTLYVGPPFQHSSPFFMLAFPRALIESSLIGACD